MKMLCSVKIRTRMQSCLEHHAHQNSVHVSSGRAGVEEIMCMLRSTNRMFLDTVDTTKGAERETSPRVPIESGRESVYIFVRLRSEG